MDVNQALRFLKELKHVDDWEKDVDNILRIFEYYFPVEYLHNRLEDEKCPIVRAVASILSLPSSTFR